MVRVHQGSTPTLTIVSNQFAPTSRGNQEGPSLGGVIPNFGPQQNVWGGFVPQPNGNAGNLAGSVNVGNLMQGNLASSCPPGGPAPGLWPAPI